MEKKELRKKIEELDIKRKVSEMKGDVVNYDTDNQYHYISEEDILELLDKAREEGRKELLTQPQTEEETKLVMPPSAYEQAEKEGYDMRKKVKSELIPEDTPEQKEEWEEEFMGVLETFKDEICSNFFASSKPLTDFIKQLLKEREKEAKIEVLTEIFQTCYQEDSRTLELVQEKLQDLKDLSLVLS